MFFNFRIYIELFNHMCHLKMVSKYLSVFSLILNVLRTVTLKMWWCLFQISGAPIDLFLSSFDSHLRVVSSHCILGYVCLCATRCSFENCL